MRRYNVPTTELKAGDVVSDRAGHVRVVDDVQDAEMRGSVVNVVTTVDPTTGHTESQVAATSKRWNRWSK